MIMYMCICVCDDKIYKNNYICLYHICILYVCKCVNWLPVLPISSAPPNLVKQRCQSIMVFKHDCPKLVTHTVDGCELLHQLNTVDYPMI